MIIGIAGASRSGKTTLAEQIYESLLTKNCRIIKQDDFVFPKQKLPRIGEELDWEHPAGIDFGRLRQAILGSKEEYTIVEGFLLFYQNDLVQLFDKKIFIEIDKPTFLERKNLDSRWGSVTQKYIEHVWSSYLLYGIPNPTHIDLRISGKKVMDHIPVILKSIQEYENKGEG